MRNDKIKGFLGFNAFRTGDYIWLLWFLWFLWFYYFFKGDHHEGR